MEMQSLKRFVTPNMPSTLHVAAECLRVHFFCLQFVCVSVCVFVCVLVCVLVCFFVCVSVGVFIGAVIGVLPGAPLRTPLVASLCDCWVLSHSVLMNGA